MEYETRIIIKSDLKEEKELLTKLKEIVEKKNGIVKRMEEGVSRRLAYKIKGKEEGKYINMDFIGDGTTVKEVEEFCHRKEGIIRNMTVKVIEKRNKIDKQKMAKEEEKKERERSE
ncbi:MAG: 30S ribosomal protein S6 [Endomicrobium sp.]|jgi:ribosomal protein S6|nr:30S ribosomal protein S6 [Endomicrobium sp.]